jgi:hypothetical protein
LPAFDFTPQQEIPAAVFAFTAIVSPPLSFMLMFFTAA